ncbi:haloacid dehalogenase [Sporosarcina sp. P37]|uniref:HAD family hydrolase n=1 Tax=unclassified Sporosarcina TaxID=2647733 RepID=UPI0009BF057D|nr:MULTISPECIES: HAD family hydrolase [unclassified Sporosarcina]ARD47321.1 haloacid dehalogenase [Sporosarcina sp. P33]ARK23886.1 haloacid dehalogenase [Sporosarcina sp. P37]PID17792.1 HAD family hydrolase [Sporosarcina sp. P35]
MIKTLIFDLDDTLIWDAKSISTAFQKTCEYATKKTGVNPVELERAVRQEARELYATYETYPHTQNIGINPFEGLWGVFDDEGEEFQKMKQIVPGYQKDAWIRGLKKLGIDDEAFGRELAEVFPRERKNSPYIYEETFEVLDQLKENYQLILLTNGSPSLQQIKLTISPEIPLYFDHIVVSGAFGKGKPDAAIFRHVLELCGIQADEALMIGDNLMTDILGSSRVDMKNVWINRENKPASDEVIPTYEIDNLKGLFPILDTLKNR